MFKKPSKYYKTADHSINKRLLFDILERTDRNRIFIVMTH